MQFLLHHISFIGATMREKILSFICVLICIAFNSCKDTGPVAIVETPGYEFIRIVEDSCLATDQITLLMNKYVENDSTLKIFIDGIPSKYFELTPSQLRVEVPQKAVQGHVTALLRCKEIFSRNIKVCPIDIYGSNKDSVFFQDNITIYIRNKQEIADDSIALYAGGVKIENFKIQNNEKISFQIPQGITDCNVYIESYGRVSNIYNQKLAGTRRLEITNIENSIKYPDDYLRFEVKNLSFDFDSTIQIYIGGISTHPYARYRDGWTGKEYLIVRIPHNTQTNTLQIKYLGAFSEVKQFNLGLALPAELDLSKYKYVNMTNPQGLHIRFTLSKESSYKFYIVKCDSVFGSSLGSGSLHLQLNISFRGELLYFSYNDIFTEYEYNKEESNIEYVSNPLSVWPTNPETNPHYYFDFPCLINIKTTTTTTDHRSGNTYSTVNNSNSNIIDLSFE